MDSEDKAAWNLQIPTPYMAHFCAQSRHFWQFAIQDAGPSQMQYNLM